MNIFLCDLKKCPYNEIVLKLSIICAFALLTLLPVGTHGHFPKGNPALWAKFPLMVGSIMRNGLERKLRLIPMKPLR